MSSSSQCSRRRRRAVLCMLRCRKRSVGKNTSGARTDESRCSRTGMAAAASPSSNKGVLNSMAAYRFRSCLLRAR